MVGIPSEAFYVLHRSFAGGIYVKRKKREARPAGVLTIFGITFFRTISLPYLKGVYKMGNSTNNFRKFGIKQRIRNFSYSDNWQLLGSVVWWLCWGISAGMSLFLRTSIIKRYSRRGRRPRRPQACSWLSFFCDAAHHRVVGDADPYDPKIKAPDNLQQPDPTHNLNSTHAPITICLRGLPAAAENDPWRFRQQSSRVISIQFWYLTSLFTSLSIGSDMDIQDGKCQNLYV